VTTTSQQYTQVLKFLYREKCINDGEIGVLPLISHDGWWLLFHVMVVVT